MANTPVSAEKATLVTHLPKSFPTWLALIATTVLLTGSASNLRDRSLPVHEVSQELVLNVGKGPGTCRCR